MRAELIITYGSNSTYLKPEILHIYYLNRKNSYPYMILKYKHLNEFKVIENNAPARIKFCASGVSRPSDKPNVAKMNENIFMVSTPTTVSSIKHFKIHAQIAT